MWKLFFETCDFLCNFIPDKARREQVRAEKLYDFRKKYRALKSAFPELKFHHVRMIKGGWNIGFIIDRKYVFKIRKIYDNATQIEKIMHEKRITDAFANISPIKIPKIEIVNTGEYTFYKYDFIPGKNLNTFSLRTIEKNADKWGTQLAEFINTVHNARPHEIDDMRGPDGDGWNHNDICNNIIVDKKTMNIVGMIDWEYAGWGELESEFNNCVIFSTKMRKSNIITVIKNQYQKLNTKRKK